MPLQAPRLDDRLFEEILRDALLRIPGYTPEWTDFNESDPGITLLQLFSWLTEMTLYRMNQLPELNYIKFLKLLGMELQPAQPATAHLTFTARPGADVRSIQRRSQIGAQPADGGELLIFETEEGLDLVRTPLTDVQVFDGAAYQVFTQANQDQGSTYRPLGWLPQVGSILYLGFQAPQGVTNPFPQQISLRVFFPKSSQSRIVENCEDAKQPPIPPVTLVWEYKLTENAAGWSHLNVFEDETAAFIREGYIKLQGPAQIEPTTVGRITEERRFWIRCRVAAGTYPAGQEPEIDFIRPNVVPAKNLSTMREELVGISEGHPDQTFELRGKPVQPDSLVLETELESQPPETWTLVGDFLSSKRENPHYSLNATTGQIKFGDGERGLIPPAGAEIIVREYRYGGGAAGNVGADAINAPLTTLIGVESVTNERDAEGGRDEQTVEELKEQAPAKLRRGNRAVTEEDFVSLALEVGGVAKATAISLAHPDFPGVDVPGAITVVIVPDTKDIPPRPSLDLVRLVCEHLNQHRLLTTEVYVKEPQYQKISVEARVLARPYAAFDKVSRDVVEAINKFLAPLGDRSQTPLAREAGPQSDRSSVQPSKGDRGWSFGQELYPTSLYSVILNVEGVAAVPNLAITLNDVPRENFTDPVVLPRDGLVYGADHQIVVAPLTDI